MRKVLLDTKVLLDFFESSRPEHRTAVDLMTVLLERGTEICVVATSLKDIYYILTRHADEAAARRCVSTLIQTATILAVDALICQDAALDAEPDFEDGIILACAARADVDVIVTRDQAAFAQAARTTPVALLARFAGDSGENHGQTNS
jgi:predicted nucleic acid-binding protein